MTNPDNTPEPPSGAPDDHGAPLSRSGLPPYSHNPRTRALMELLEGQVQTMASAMTGVMATLDMLRTLPPQRPDPAGAVVPQAKPDPMANLATFDDP